MVHSCLYTVSGTQLLVVCSCLYTVQPTSHPGLYLSANQLTVSIALLISDSLCGAGWAYFLQATASDTDSLGFLSLVAALGQKLIKY